MYLILKCYLYLAELALKAQQLATEIEAHKVTQENLEQARRDVKKKNVLSLEMKDYERSMKELSTKMEESKKKIIQVFFSYFLKLVLIKRNVTKLYPCKFYVFFGSQNQ